MSTAKGVLRFRIYEPGDEARILDVLEKCLHGWRGRDRAELMALWRWRHSGRRDFQPDDIVVALIDDEVVACFHGGVFALRYDEGLSVPVSLDGDFAVLPEYRRSGIPDDAHDWMDRTLLRRGVALRGGYASVELNRRFYHKRFGYVFIPSVTTYYRRLLDTEPLGALLAAAGRDLLRHDALRAHLAHRGRWIVALNLEALPECHLVATREGLQLERGPAERPDMSVRLSQALLAASARGALPFVLRLGLELAWGRCRVSGLFRNWRTVLLFVWSMLGRRETGV